MLEYLQSREGKTKKAKTKSSTSMMGKDLMRGCRRKEHLDREAAHAATSNNESEESSSSSDKNNEKDGTKVSGIHVVGIMKNRRTKRGFHEFQVICGDSHHIWLKRPEIEE